MLPRREDATTLLTLTAGINCHPSVRKGIGGAPLMAASIEEITKEAIGLPRHQRLALVRLLLDLDQRGASDEIESAWDEEIRARIKARSRRRHPL